jgi:hypothetical protein
MKSILAILSLALAVSAGNDWAHQENNHKECGPPQKFTSPAGLEYTYFVDCALSRRQAQEQCRDLGLSLASVPSVDEFKFLVQTVDRISWIGLWEGNDYDACIAFFPGGAIAVPNGDCESHHAFLCN